MIERKPPKHLSVEMKKWFLHVIGEYELDDHHVKVLRLACEAYDRCQAARKAIKKHGSMTFMDRFDQPRPLPEVAIERNAAIAYARLLRELALDDDLQT